MKSPLAYLALLLPLAACATSQGPPLHKIAPEINATLSSQVPIAVGDTVELRFSFPEIATDWDQQVEVQPNGRASFKALDEVPVAGFTAEDLDERLEDAYQGILDDPDLTVMVKARANRTVTVMGEVGQSAELEIGGGQRLTLVEAIGRSGSFNAQTAWMSNLLLVRWDAANQKQIHWVLDARPRYWRGEEPIYLQPWDVIYIPNTPITRAGLWVDSWIRRMIPLPFFRLG